jgi:hypothetical protein
MIETNCHACHRYELQEVQNVDRHEAPSVPSCFHHRHSHGLSGTYGCQDYLPWLQVAQEVIYRDLRTLHQEMNGTRHGYRSLFGSLNRQGHDLSARIRELEALLRQSEAIPSTTAKPRELMGTKTPSVSMYVEALRDMLARWPAVSHQSQTPHVPTGGSATVSGRRARG